MNGNHIFIDTNVLIGYWSGIDDDCRCIKYLFTLRGKRLYTSSLSIAQFVSVFQKTKPNAEIRKAVNELTAKFNILSFTEKDIADSLEITGLDMEDNIQYVISRKGKCFHFVTNNKKDYTNLTNINVVKPSQIRQINQ
jgi:predicted nucleic acid-binding protein